MLWRGGVIANLEPTSTWFLLLDSCAIAHDSGQPSAKSRKKRHKAAQTWGLHLLLCIRQATRVVVSRIILGESEKLDKSAGSARFFLVGLGWIVDL